MTQTVTALYDTYNFAVSAVNALEAGVPHSDISIVSNNVDNRYTKDRPTHAAEDVAKGAGIGAAVGGVGGLLTGLGLLAIPGVGPVVAAGWLVATAAGAATGAVVGAAAGGLVGSLTGAGVPERDAQFYAEGVRRVRRQHRPQPPLSPHRQPQRQATPRPQPVQHPELLKGRAQLEDRRHRPLRLRCQRPSRRPRQRLSDDLC